MNDNTISPEEARDVDLPRLLRAVWSRAWIVALASILSMVIVFLATYFLVTPKYEAHAMFYVNNSSINVGDASVSLSSSDITASKSLVDTYIVILDTWETQKDVIDYAGLNMTCEAFMEMVSSEAVNETEVFRVTITSEDPEEAAKLANAVAYILPKRIDSIVEGTSAQIVSSARTPSRPSSPNYIVNSLVGFILGFVLSIGIIAMLEWLDITIRTDGDVLQSSSLPLLAKIPDMTQKSKSGYYGYGDESQSLTIGSQVVGLSQRDHLLSDRSHFLGAGNGGLDLAVLQQVSHHSAHHSHTLIGGSAKLTITGHVTHSFLQRNSLNSRRWPGSGPSLPAC